MLETLNSSHVNTVTRLHLRTLTGLLRDLGPSVTSAFYHGAVRSSNAIAYVFIKDENVVGFVLGSANPPKLRHDILANSFFRILGGMCVGIVRKPSILWSVSSSLLPGGEDYDPRAAELTYLAVDPVQRSSGIGKQLVERFDQALIESHVTAYELSVDADNKNASMFYERLGFSKIGQYQEFGIEHRRYRRELI